MANGAADVPEEGDVPSDAIESPVPSLGIALSGGGTRAALFSLGVLNAVIDLECNDRLGMIASVSGGSITNACLSQALDFRECTSEEFGRVAGPLAEGLCNTGMFVLGSAGVFRPMGFMGRVILPVAAVYAFLCFALGGVSLWWFGSLAIVQFVAATLSCRAGSKSCSTRA